MKRKWLVASVSVLFALVLALAGYEGVAVARAKARTPAILHSAAPRELPLSAFSTQRREALLAVEDPGFYRHHGVDFSTPGQGMTTITQALVKRLYFERFTPGFAKLEQSLIARYVLDPAMSKDDQLATFVNRAYFGEAHGRSIIGFADAARAYHGRAFAALDEREYLSLVAMLMAPNALDPVQHPAQNAERVRRIEALLAGRCRPAGLRDVTYKDCRRHG